MVPNQKSAAGKENIVVIDFDNAVDHKERENEVKEREKVGEEEP